MSGGKAVEFPKRREESDLGEPRNLTTEDVREHFGLESLAAVRRIPADQLPYVKIGGQRRYRASDVKRYELEHLVKERR